MTLARVKEAIERLTYAHPLACTNVESVENVGTDVVFVPYEDDEQTAELEDAKQEIKSLEERVEELEKERDELEEAGRANAELVANLNDGVCSIDEYRKDAIEANERAREWQKAHDEMERELKALRSRKGVSAELFKHQTKILEHLYTVAYSKSENPFYARNSARELYQTLQGRKPVPATCTTQ